MIIKQKPCAVAVFQSKKNGKTYAKVWYPIENSFVLGTPVEVFFKEIDSSISAESLFSIEHFIAIENNKIVSVDFGL